MQIDCENSAYSCERGLNTLWRSRCSEGELPIPWRNNFHLCNSFLEKKLGRFYWNLKWCLQRAIMFCSICFTRLSSCSNLKHSGRSIIEPRNMWICVNVCGAKESQSKLFCKAPKQKRRAESRGRRSHVRGRSRRKAPRSPLTHIVWVRLEGQAYKEKEPTPSSRIRRCLKIGCWLLWLWSSM